MHRKLRHMGLVACARKLDIKVADGGIALGFEDKRLHPLGIAHGLLEVIQHGLEEAALKIINVAVINLAHLRRHRGGVELID